MKVNGSFVCENPKLENPKCSSPGEYLNNIMEFYSAGKRKELLTKSATWLSLKDVIMPAEGGKPVSKSYKLHDFIYVTHSKKHNCSEGEQVSGHQGFWVSKGRLPGVSLGPRHCSVPSLRWWLPRFVHVLTYRDLYTKRRKSQIYCMINSSLKLYNNW